MRTAEDISASDPRAWIEGLGGVRRAGFAFGAGAVGALAHAPWHIWPAFALAVMALVLLLDGATAQARPLRAAFNRAFWFGFGYFLITLNWIGAAFLQVDDGAAYLAPAGVLALTAGMGLFFGLGGLAAMPLWTRDARRIPVLAAAMTGAELLRGHLFGGFPWVLAGYVWPAGEPVSQVAAFVGIYGLTALTWLAAAAPAALFDGHRAWLARIGPTLAAALGLGLVWGAGYQRLMSAPVAQLGETPIVRVADSGLSQRAKTASTRDQEQQVLTRLLAATGGWRESRADVVIWPEGAIPVTNFFVFERTLDAEGGERYVRPGSRGEALVQDIGKALGDRVLIVGATSVRRGRTPEEDVFFNSAAVIDSISGRPTVFSMVDKRRLVPFGEFLPLWELYSTVPLAPLQNIGAGFTPGGPPQRQVIPAERGQSALVLICYEAIFPGFAPRDERPGWLVAVTNDAWFSYGVPWLPAIGPPQHFNQARYRAIEEGLAMARAASGGTSALVDSFGRVTARADRNLHFVEAQLPPSLPSTVFVQFGFLTLPLLLAGLVALRFAPPGAPVRGLRS